MSQRDIHHRRVGVGTLEIDEKHDGVMLITDFSDEVMIFEPGVAIELAEEILASAKEALS